MYGFQGAYGGYQQFPGANAYQQQSMPTQPQQLQQQQQPGLYGAAGVPPAYPQYTASAYGYGGQPAGNPAGAGANYAQAAQVQQVSRLSDMYAANAMGYQQPQAAAAHSNYYRPSPAVNTMNKPIQPVQNNSGANASGYSGYDAAVYAAASSYLQSKATGQTKMWMSKTTGGAFPNRAGGPGPRRFGVGAQKDSHQFYCEVCKISCAGSLTYKEHLEGQRHKKKEALAKGENQQSLPKNKLSYRCDLCSVTCTGQDTYQAHVRGTKHVKTVALCKKLGKPVPDENPTILAPAEMGGALKKAKVSGSTIPTVGAVSKKVVGISTVKFVGGSKLSSTGQLEGKKEAVKSAVGSAGKETLESMEVESEQLKALMAAEEVKPVGEDKVIAEKDATGKLIQYVCTLCDCKFSDPNAKDIHLKGRRHRLAYKQKIDPTLVVDMKPSNKRAREGDMRGRRFPDAPIQSANGLPERGPWFGFPPPEARRFEQLEQRYVEEKHSLIYPSDEMLSAVEKIIFSTEATFKSISEELDKSEKEKGDAGVKERLLQGVMRVGNLSKNLLIKSDAIVDLVIICSRVPTEENIREIQTVFPKVAKEMSVASDPVSPACLFVARTDSTIRCRVTFTCPGLREATEDVACVDKERCLIALAELRRAKWFSMRCMYLQSCQIVLRLIRDIRERNENWQCLDDYTCELLVEKIISSYPTPLSATDAIRRVFEAISSGVLLVGVIMDPCEKEKKNVLDDITIEKKHAVTSSAQQALRLIAFNQFYKVLGIDRLSDVRPSLNNDRKRPMEESEEDNGEEIKKEKLEETATD